MDRDSQLPLVGTAGETPGRDRTDVVAALAALAAAQPSRRAAHALLRDAGVLDASLGRFYAATRAGVTAEALAPLVGDARLAAARALLAAPPRALPRVAVSTLANQFYCEQQVHLGTLHDLRVVSAALAAGAAGHARFEAEAEPVTEDEVARRVAAGEAFGLVEMPLRAEREGVQVVGRADRVQLRGAAARVVLEFKFSSRAELFASHVAQVEAYGLLLAAAGYATDALVHAVAFLPRGAAHADPGLAERLAARAVAIADAEPFARSNATVAHDPLAGLAARKDTVGAATLYVFAHDAAAAASHVGWALGYWRSERAPVPTNAPSKCRACPFNAAGLCDLARAAPDGRYDARAVQGRRGVLHLVGPAAPRGGA